MSGVQVDRGAVLGYRWRRHQLDRSAGAAASVTDVDLLDVGVQDTGPDGARWALAVRGAPPGEPAHGLDPDLAYAWTLRGAPHAYRRQDLAAVALATAPWSEADAARRIFDAAKPLRQAGLDVLGALAQVARLERELVVDPTAKGELSQRLTERVDPPLLRRCRPCDATHLYEQPFRLSALQAGLELEPGTSPPVLHRIDGLVPNLFAVADRAGDPRFDPVRAYLRFWGPGHPKEVAEFLDTAVAAVRARWPDDVVDVEIEGVEPGSGGRRQILAADVDDLVAGGDVARGTAGMVRLVGPYDPYLQLRGRSLLVPDPADQKAVWPVLGRPGAVLCDGQLVGTWRPRTDKGRLAVRYDPWASDGDRPRAAVEVEAERLADFRGVAFAGLVDP